MRKAKKMSAISKLHIFKLVYRSLLFLIALAMCIIKHFVDIGFTHPLVITLMSITWLVYVVEMILRFFPSKLESPGCQKQFKRNFVPTEVGAPKKQSWKVTALVALVWIALNAVIGILHITLPHIFTDAILLLISLGYGVCDIICILFFCPFQSWFMKNRCCATCRIYNWDFAMMFTPLIFIAPTKLFVIYAWSLLAFGLALLIRWEVTHKIHPERFYEESNCSLSCANCTEKLCHHKTQLHWLWRKWKGRVKTRLSETGKTVKEKIKKKK